MEEDDTHLCLTCNQTIVGLMNYVVHKKSQCQKRRSADQSQQQRQQHDQVGYNNGQQLFGPTLNVRGNTGQSHGEDNQNDLLGAPHRYGLRSQDNVMLSSLQQTSDYGNQQQTSQNSSTPAFNSSQSNGGHPTGTGLSVDVSSPLASFIDSAFSPGDDSPVDADPVLQGPDSPRSRPDFFQSLELKSITGRERSATESQGRNLRSRRRGLQEDTLDLDLPITMILSNLDFSSDEEENGVVGFPLEDEVSDNSDSELEWSSPPKTHTGGKWKPGHGPTKKYHPHGPVGGKWKPGQCPQESKAKKDVAAGVVKYTKPFFCNLCKATFPNRFNYNEHFESKIHKDALEAQKSGTTGKKGLQSDEDGGLMLALDPTTGEFTESAVEPESDTPQISLSGSSLSKKRQYSGPFCETCDLYFDSIRVYNIHCETKKHKQNVEKRNQDLREAMLGPLDDKGTGKSDVNKDVESDNVPEQESAERKKGSLPETHYCIVCKKTFKRKYEMARHLLTHFHKQRAMKHPRALEMLDKYNKYVIRLCPFQCNICQFYFNRSSDLLDHLQTPGHELHCSDLVGPLLCVTCKYKTYSPDTLLQHVQSQSHKQTVASNHHVCIIKECHSKITCKYCGVQMHSAVRMKRHIEFRHKNRKIQEPLEVRSGKSSKVMCPDCGKVYRNKSALLRHYQHHQKTQAYRCDTCNKSFSAIRGLNNHLNTSLHERREKMLGKNLRVVEVSDSEDETESVKDSTLSIKRDNSETEGKEKAENSQSTNQPRRSSRPRKPKKFDMTETVQSLPRSNKSAETQTAAPVSDMSAVGSQEDLGEMEHQDGLSVSLDLEVESDLNYSPETSDAESSLEEQSESIPNGDAAKDVTAGNVSDLVQKKKICKGTGLFTCEHCDFVGNEMEDLRQHYSSEHPSQIIKCEPCSQFFLSAKAYKIHCAGGTHQSCLNKLDTTVKMELRACPHCSKKFSDDESYELHVEFVHLHVSSEEAVQRVCQGRDMVSQLYGEHLRQLDSISHDSSVSCPECGKFVMKNNLIEHLRTHTGERPFKCRHCPRDFGSRMSLRRHLIEHIGKTSFTCETCGKVFKKRGAYTIHMRMHVSEKKGLKFDCEDCGASFLLESQLAHHKKRHGDRNFKCTIPGCHWSFVLKTELEQHMMTHTKEKKYLCDICGWAAYSTTNLKRHSKTHQPAKEIPCEYCPYKAGCKTHLKRHMRIHIGAKPFKCLYCSYACNTHENMRKHILKTRKHKGLKIYPCKFCDYQSNEAKDFKKHLMVDHIDYVKTRASESLVKFTGLYHPEEDITQPREGSEIHQVMKGRFIKVYDGTRVGGTGDPVAPPNKKKKPRRNEQQTQEEQKAMPESKSETVTPSEQIQVQDIVDTTGAPVALISHEQQPTVSSLQQAEICPRGLPWTVVAQDNRNGNWCQSMDVVVPQSLGYRAPEAVQVVNDAAGNTAYITCSGTEMPAILTMVNVDSQTFQQIEASGYQVIATGGTTINQ